MHIHCLTDNNKVVSVKKNCEVPKCEKYPFQNIRNTASDNLAAPPPPLPPFPVSPVSFGPPLPWIAPPRRETWLWAWLVIF